jgi:Resolvase, N terminal domain
VRKSTEQTGTDADATSVARQIENARAFAASKGRTVADAHVYADDAVGGAETKKLVQRARLLAVMGDRPPFSQLIVRDSSRFSRRDGHEAFGELKRIAQSGVEIWFYQDGTRFQYGTLSDNVVGFVRAEMNAEFRRQIGRGQTAPRTVRWFLVGEVRGQSLSGREEFLLVDDVVPIEHGPRFVAGEQHGDPFRDARPNQVPCGGAAAIVEEPVWKLNREPHMTPNQTQ